MRPHTGWMECPPVLAQVWLDEHEEDLGGVSVDAAVALVEGAGLRAHVVPYASRSAAAEQRHDRVNLRLTAAGELAAVDAG